jgi:Tol biopolymer transport system component
VGLLALATTWLYSRRAIAEPPVVEIAILPPPGTTFVTSAGGPWPMVSPDGSKVVFVALSPAGQQIWLRSLDSATARPLEGTEGAIRPFWSPDSRSIGFFANGQLRRFDLDTRSVRVLTEAPYQGGLAGTWGDGTILFNGAGGIQRVPADGGSRTRVLEATDAFDFAVPSFLPDGRRFLYLTIGRQGGPNDLCLASLEVPERTCVRGAVSPVAYDPSGYLLFVRDGTLRAQPFDATRGRFEGDDPATLVDDPIDIEVIWQGVRFSASANGVLAYYTRPADKLAWLDQSGRVLEVLPIHGTNPAVSPDEAQIVAARRDPRTLNSDLWLYDRSRGTESRFTFAPVGDMQPAFSSDGARVLFGAGAGGRLLQKPVAGGEEAPVTTVVGAQPDWSVDGRFVAYQLSVPGTGFDLWAAPLSGDGKPFPIAQTAHGEREPAFAPDVRWIAYDSTESGRREVWVQPFPPTGARWQVSTGGGVSPRWRADGGELFYVAADGKLTSVEVTPGTTFRWGQPRALFETMFRGGTYAPFAVSRDGRRFLMNVPPSMAEESPITVVLNWPARLRK